MNEMTDISKNGRPDRALTDQENRQISSRLQQYYESIREQEIPDRFLDLLEKLDQAELAAKTGSEDRKI